MKRSRIHDMNRRVVCKLLSELELVFFITPQKFQRIRSSRDRVFQHGEEKRNARTRPGPGRTVVESGEVVIVAAVERISQAARNAGSISAYGFEPEPTLRGEFLQNLL